MSASLLATLLGEPGRFSFDAAVAVLVAAGAGRPLETLLRFEAVPGLRPSGGDVLVVREDADGRFTLQVGFSGLTGPGGVLPRPYTELANEERRRRAPAFAAFFDVLAQRALQQFAQAGIKYLPHRVSSVSAATGRRDDPFVAVLLALAGHGQPGDLERSGLGPGELLYFAGMFAARPRSADRLAALLEEWLEAPVRIEQFAGAWLPLDGDDRSRLGTAHSRLDADLAAGTRVWDVGGRVRVVIGPLGLDAFSELLPGQSRLRLLGRVIRTYLDDEARFSVNPVLRADAVPPPRVGEARLGLTSWLPASGTRLAHAADAVFADRETG